MPQLEAFNRRWSIGSDDFVFTGIVDFLLRIIWLIVVIVVYSLAHDDLPNVMCPTYNYLHVYFIGLMVVLAVTAILAALMVYVSTKGTIADSSARTNMPRLIYVRFAVALPEVTWNALGTYWAFSSSKMCHRTIVNIAKGTVITGWVVVLVAVLSFVILFNAYGKKTRAPSRLRSFKRGSRRPLSHDKQWLKRCKCMFYCAKGDDRSTSVFTTLAELSADYFKGVDLVPTDVVAGLILLSRRQERKRTQLTLVVSSDDAAKRYSSIPASDEDVVDSSCVTLRGRQPVPKDWMTLSNMHHYLMYALGSYGWPFYIALTNPVFGACSLCTECRCCRCNDDQGSVYMDNCCMCNTAAFKKTTGIHHDDIVYVSFQNGICEIPFYVVIDRAKKSIVIAVRGTLSLQDVVTDLVLVRGDMPDIEGVGCTSAHNGILDSAMYIKKTLDDKRILEDAFSQAEGADLVVTGHSLGAGAAAMLAILLKPKYPNLRCFAFSPPGELVSPDLSEYAQDIVCSCVLGDDIITRQGMVMMDDLKIQILKAISETKLPKHKILATGCWRWCCGRAGILDENIVRGHSENQDMTDSTIIISDSSTNACAVKRSSLEYSLKDCLEHSKHIQCTYQPLQLPGQIIHIEESNFSGDEQYLATWKDADEFREIIVSPDMLAHHFPDALLEAIDQLQTQNFDIMKSNNNQQIRRNDLPSISET